MTKKAKQIDDDDFDDVDVNDDDNELDNDESNEDESDDDSIEVYGDDPSNYEQSFVDSETEASEDKKTKLTNKERIPPVKKKVFPQINDQLSEVINHLVEELIHKKKFIDWSPFILCIKRNDWPPMEVNRSMSDEMIKIKTLSNILHLAFQADGQKAEDFLIVANKYYVGMTPIDFLSAGKIEYVVNVLAKRLGVEPTSIYQ